MMFRAEWNLKWAALGLLTAGLSLPVCGQAAARTGESRDGYRVVRLNVPTTGRAGFTLLTPAETGVFFTNQISYDRSLTNKVLLEGGGVCAGDVDGDGWVDLYFCQVGGANALFRNLGGGKFQNVTAESGGAGTNQTSRGAMLADLNGDGALDLMVTSHGGPNAFYVNDGKGHFRDMTREAGLILTGLSSTSLTLADWGGTGSLGLYVVNTDVFTGPDGLVPTSVTTVNGQPRIMGRAAQTRQIIDGALVRLGVPDSAYRSDGRGHFTPVAWTDGTFRTADGQPLGKAPRGLGLAAAFHDLNGDGVPDLYVCNDMQTPDHIWMSDGQGHFRALPDLAMRTTCFASMAVDFADLNGDGFDDIFVVDMISRFHARRLTQMREKNPSARLMGEEVDRQQAHRNTLQLSRGDGTYAEIANYAGLDASDWTWGAAFLDVDLDGYEDLLCVNGHRYELQNLDSMEKETRMGRATVPVPGGKALRDYPPLATPNFLFRNRGDLSFEEVGATWGFNSSNVSHGLALADLDQDGDLDVIVSCLGEPPLIYRNESPAPRVAIRLKGRAPNTQGIGARITVRGGAVPSQSLEMQAGGRYLSSDEAVRVFAAGSLTNKLTVEVRWRSGRRSLITDAEPNCAYEIDEAFAITAPPEAKPPAPPPYFEDVSARLNHVHEDPPFNDLERQPLLPKMLSRSGPGTAWFDLDGDGRDELIIGGAKGGTLVVFKSDGQGNFTRWPIPSWQTPLTDDATGLVGWTPAPGQRALLAGVSRYETDLAAAPAVWQFTVASAPQAAVPDGPERLSPGPLAVADYDGDGALDVVVGGRTVPGRYPEATATRLFRNAGGKLVLDRENSAVMKQAGLVNGAVFSDLDGDGFPDLILACEWGPVRIFRNDHGRFLSWNPRVTGASLNSQLSTLHDLTGWWQGVTTGDLDGDGRLDIIASNWGLNSSYHRPSAGQPVRFYYGDFDDNGTMDVLETEYDERTGQVVPRRDLGFLSKGWPVLRSRFPTYQSLSTATVQTVLGEALPKAQQVQATTLASMLFLNRGDHFEAVPLPREAQFAPACAVSVADLDGDGNEDIFLSQNFFAMRAEDPRLDAGRGLWLRGDGTGRLTPVPGHVSGVKVYGEQRGAALADYDEDGRVDLVVSQNNAATKLYHNLGAKPGLVVRLQGLPGNPTAVGASLRLIFGPQAGPVREIHAGSGYCSQDGAVQVMALPQPATKIWVRWPGGKTTTSVVPAGAKSIVVGANGAVTAR